MGVNPVIEYNGPAYVGAAYSPFAITGDPNRPDFEVPNVGLSDPAQATRLSDRIALRRNLDNLERNFDREGELAALGSVRNAGHVAANQSADHARPST